MLLTFTAKNYRSFKEEMVFSMEPVPKQKDLEYSILKKKIGRKTYKGLCSAVIYGPNASGKTNIVGAMDSFKSIVLRGNLYNVESESPNIAANQLELIPNNTLAVSRPVEFAIKFITEGMLFEYRVALDLGGFLDSNYHRKIIQEELRVNEMLLYLRGDTLTFGDLDAVENLLVNNFKSSKAGIIAIAKSNLNESELFLMNGFKTMFSSRMVEYIASWLRTKFIVVYRADAVQMLPNTEEKKIFVEKSVNEAAKLFGINSNALGYYFDKESQETRLVSMFEKGISGRGTMLPAEFFESYGTIRFTNLFPLVLAVMQNGGILIVDEFDASIHPMALMSIINIFHNDEINTNHAQLVFNTHNPIFLNSSLFRRDEIKFVERDDDTHCSEQYSLADFGTSGRNGVRRTDDYMKNYFVDRYGAIKDIDFTPVISGLNEVSR